MPRPFNSVTGRWAFNHKGGYATARYWRSKNWSQPKAALRLGTRVWQRLRCPVLLASVDLRMRTVTGLGLVEVASLWQRGQLDDYLAELDRQDRAAFKAAQSLPK